MRENICKYVSDKELISKIYKEYIQLSIKKNPHKFNFGAALKVCEDAGTEPLEPELLEPVCGQSFWGRQMPCHWRHPSSFTERSTRDQWQLLPEWQIHLRTAANFLNPFLLSDKLRVPHPVLHPEFRDCSSQWRNPCRTGCRVDERLLVLQPGIRAVPLRWESQMQDTGPQETSQLHIIPNGKNLSEISISTSRPSFTQRPVSYSAGHSMPNN